MQRALAVEFDQRAREREKERERDRERDLKKKKIEDLNTLPCRVRVVVNLFLFQWFRGSIPNEFRGTFLQRESKHTEALIGCHPIGHL